MPAAKVLTLPIFKKSSTITSTRIINAHTPKLTTPPVYFVRTLVFATLELFATLVPILTASSVIVNIVFFVTLASDTSSSSLSS